MAKLPEFSNPSQPRASASALALERAVLALRMRQPAGAERIANDVLKANRSDPRALQILGHALMLQGRAADAIQPLEKALRRTDDPAIATQLAVALRAAGRHDDALDRLRRVTARRPPFAPAFSELGQQLMTLSRHDEAIDLLKRGLALIPNDADLSMQLGHILAMRGDRANARAAFAQALANAPGRVDAMHALATGMQTDGAYAEAAELFRRVLGANHDDAAARLGLGVCLLELGQSDQALDCFRAAMRSGSRMYGQALAALASSPRGRFWLKPSGVARFMNGETN